MSLVSALASFWPSMSLPWITPGGGSSWYLKRARARLEKDARGCEALAYGNDVLGFGAPHVRVLAAAARAEGARGAQRREEDQRVAGGHDELAGVHEALVFVFVRRGVVRVTLL